MSKISDIRDLIDSMIKQQDNAAICAKAYSEIAEKLDEFYKKKIAPNTASILPKLQQNVEDYKKRINQMIEQNNQLQELVDQEKALEQQENEINSKHQLLEERQKIIEELKKKKQELDKPENQFDSLEMVISSIQLENNKIVEEQTVILERVNNLLNSYTTEIDKRLQDDILKAKENLALLGNKSKEMLKSLDSTPLSTCLQTINKDLDKLIADYNSYVKKIKAISEELRIVEEKHSKIVELYKEQYDEDKDVFGNLEERGNVEKYINEHAKEIENFLKKFEAMLKELIQKRSNLSIPEIYEKQYNKQNKE